MLIGRLAIFWLVCITWIVSASYECAYEDEGGGITVKVVSRDEAISCVNCQCKRIKVECLFGPDSQGGFQHLNVTKSYADSCDRSKCVCSSHGSDYVQKAEQRRKEDHNTVNKMKENFLEEATTNGGTNTKELEKEVIDDSNTGVDTDDTGSEDDDDKDSGNEPRPVPPYSDDDASYYCSFGQDKNGDEISGLITSLSYELLCATGESICECTEIIPVTGEDDGVPHKF